MSIKRLTSDERATYFIGLAVRRQIERSPRDPENAKQINVVLRWAEHWLSDDELYDVSINTGYTFDEDFEDEMQRIEKMVEGWKDAPPDPDTPF